MYLLPKPAALPKHTAVSIDLGDKQFVFEDTRYFGRLTLETSAIERLGPEPLSHEWTASLFAEALRSSTQPIKVKLLDQTLVAGIGNIYASEALFRSGISPRVPARRLRDQQVLQLWRSIREVLAEAIDRGSSQELNYAGDSERADGFFYYGRSAGEALPEPFSVYGRLGEPCSICGQPIRRLIQAARSTFYCPHCQSPNLGRRTRTCPQNSASSI
jgi:formamidopyrimidine-DNA glycosylase